MSCSQHLGGSFLRSIDLGRKTEGILTKKWYYIGNELWTVSYILYF